MKEFPRFSDAVLLHELTQPQAKVVLLALRTLDAFLTQENQTIEGLPLTALIEAAEQSYGFRFSADLVSNPRNLLPGVHQLIDAICNAYTASQDKHIRIASEALHEFHDEHFEPDVFNFPVGETLRIAGHEYI